MNNRKIIKGYKTSISSRFNEDTSKDKFKDGIIYTLYSDEFNSLKVGFAENVKVLEEKLKKNFYVHKFKCNRTLKFLWYLYL